jgi:actinin alpha
MSAGLNSSSSSDWIAIQKKTFTRWANTHLKKRNLEIKDMFQDLKTGILFLNLLEIIGGESVKTVCGRKMNLKPKMRIHNLENCNLIIDYLKKKEIKLTNIGSQDIVDGKEHLILGLFWMVILRFVVAEDGKDGLLLWVKMCTKDYDNVDVKNFHRDWKDGLAFVGLIHHHRPDMIADPRTLNPEDDAANLELAFKVAEDLGISRLLDVEDITGTPKPDDKSIIAYVSAFYNMFASQAMNDRFTHAIESAIEVTKRHDKLIGQFEAESAELSEWVSSTTEKFSGAEMKDSTEGIKDDLDNLYGWRASEKPSKAGLKMDVENVLRSLQSSCTNNNRPVYTPAAATEPAALNTAWEALEAAENSQESKLRENYAAYQKVDFASRKFENKASKFEKWANAKNALFCGKSRRASVTSTVTQVEALIDAHNIYEDQLEKYKEAVGQLQTLADEIGQVPAHKQCAPTQERVASVKELLATVEGNGTTYKSQLLLWREEEAKLAQLMKDATRDGERLVYEVDNLSDDIEEPVIGEAGAIQAQLDILSGPIRERITAVDEKLTALRGNNTTIVEAGRQLECSPAVHELIDDAEATSKLTVQADARAQALSDELAQEQNKDSLRHTFADAATAFVDNLKAKQGELEAITGTPEEQLAATNAAQSAYATSSEDVLKPVEEAAAAMDSAGVVINPYSAETIHSLRAQHTELGKAYQLQAETLQQKINADKEGAVTPEQLKEIQEVFTYFDSDGSGTLNLQEFKDGCQGTGLFMSDEEVESQFGRLAPDGKMSFDSFTGFMKDQLTQGSSQDDVVGAFKQLSGDPQMICDEDVDKFFGNADTNAYLHENGLGGDYKIFTEKLFSR